MCSPVCMRNGFRTARRRRSSPPCWTREPIIVPCDRCIGFWMQRVRRVSAAINSPIPPIRNRSCWPQGRISSRKYGPVAWSWDITKLKGHAKWTYFYLYVILDVFSRYVVGWMGAPRETAELAKRLIADPCDKQNIEPDQLRDPER